MTNGTPHIFEYMIKMIGILHVNISAGVTTRLPKELLDRFYAVLNVSWVFVLLEFFVKV